MVRPINSSGVTQPPRIAAATQKKQVPESADSIGNNRSNLANRTSVYDHMGINTDQPPGMPTPRDRDSEKIVSRDDDKYSLAHNLPVRMLRLRDATPFSPEQVRQHTAPASRASVYDSLGVEPHQPPGVPTARDLDSEKIAYQDSDKYSVAHNPPLVSSRRQEVPFSAEQIHSHTTAAKRTSVYDALGVDTHSAPGIPSARDRDSEKIVYQDSDKHSVAHNPPLPASRHRDATPFSAGQVNQHTGAKNRTSVYDALNAEANQPPGMPSARDRDSEKIPVDRRTSAESSTAAGVRETTTRKNPAELDSRPLFEIAGDFGRAELPSSKH